MERLDDDLRREFGMSLTEYEVLVRLSERPGRAMRMAQLADALAHSRSRVTHTVARMEAAGFVTRGTTPEDGRGVVATMTTQGYELLEKAAPCHVESVRRNLVDLVPATTSPPSAGSWTASPTTSSRGTRSPRSADAWLEPVPVTATLVSQISLQA